MPQRLAFHTQGLIVGFQTRVILNGLSMEIPWGRTTVILGPGGSGKSTLLRLCGGGLPTGSGFWQEGSFESAAEDVTRLPQCGHHLPGELRTLAEGLEQVTGESAEPALRSIWNAAPDAEQYLRPLLHTQLEALDSGQRRLAEFTLATATSSPILLLDEPEMGLSIDPTSWVLRKLVATGHTRTQVIVTHNLDLAQTVGQLVMLLVDGELVEIADNETFFGSPLRTRTREYLRWGA